MDEPTEGLAPLLVREVGRVIESLKAEGLSILLVEQNLPMALRVADHVHVLSRGRVVHSSAPGRPLATTRRSSRGISDCEVQRDSTHRDHRCRAARVGGGVAPVDRRLRGHRLRQPARPAEGAPAARARGRVQREGGGDGRRCRLHDLALPGDGRGGGARAGRYPREPGAAGHGDPDEHDLSDPDAPARGGGRLGGTRLPRHADERNEHHGGARGLHDLRRRRRGARRAIPAGLRGHRQADHSRGAGRQRVARQARDEPPGRPEHGRAGRGAGARREGRASRLRRSWTS